MRKLLVTLLTLIPIMSFAQVGYDRRQIAQWLQDGAWDEIVTVAQRVEAPDSFLLQSAGYASYQAGDKSAAAGYYNQLLARDSDSRQALYYSAVMLKADERYREAIPLLERLCRKAPMVAQYHVLLGDCYSTQSKFTDAVGQLQAARNLSPNSAIIGNKLANAFGKVRAWDSAMQVLDVAMLQHPGDAALISTGISITYTRKQYARTSAFTDSLIATRKLKYEALLTGLYADIELKNYEHAIRVGNVIMALGSETEEVLYYTAIAHQQLGHWRTADTLLQKCIAKVLKPNLEGYYVALGEGAAKQGQWARSKACYDTAYYLFKRPLTLYRKGFVLENAGKGAEATQAYKRYLALPVAVQDTNISKYLKRYVGNSN
jgi:tetratricopeptide (TPR) repeat protein